jgi:hypothetical protein
VVERAPVPQFLCVLARGLKLVGDPRTAHEYCFVAKKLFELTSDICCGDVLCELAWGDAAPKLVRPD